MQYKIIKELFNNKFRFGISSDYIIKTNSIYARGDFCHLLTALANSLDPNQNW